MKRQNLSSDNKYLLILGHIGAFLTVTAWGISFLSTKVLMQDGGFTPAEMYVYRFSAAYVILFLLTCRKFLADSWKDELQLMVCGLCAGSIYFVTENYGLKYTSAGNVSMIVSLSPLLTALLASAVYKMKLKTGIIIGSLMAIVGVGCIILGNGEGFVIKPKGDVLALAAAFSWAVYTIFVKRLLPLYKTLFITRKLFFYGVVSALPLLIMQKEPLHLKLLFDFSEATYMLNFLFLVLFCSLGAYVVWNEAMKILGPVKSNNYLYLQPLMTLIAAYLLFGETVKPLGVAGCVLVIGGLVISDKLKIKDSSK